MSNGKRYYLAVAALMLVALLAQPATARAYDAEVRTCVDAVNGSVDLQQAERVRHVVILLRRTGIGRVIEIETSVFTDADTRTYNAYCVAGAGAEPVKFRISETAT